MSLVIYLKSNCHTQGHLGFFLLSSGSLIVLHFIFRCATHFELIFVKSIRSMSRFIFLHMDVKLLQQHLLKRLSLLHCIVFVSLLKINWLYLHGLFLDSLLCSTDTFAFSFASTIVSRLQYLYSEPWCWVVSVFQLCSFTSTFCWLFYMVFLSI